MAHEPEQEQPTREAPEPKSGAPERKQTSHADEAREDGMPGYGQPDEDVREQSLPEQPW